MSERAGSAEIIPFPGRAASVSPRIEPASPAPPAAEQPADPQERLRLALAQLNAALAEQRTALASWRGALADLGTSVHGLRGSFEALEGQLDTLKTQIGR